MNKLHAFLIYFSVILSAVQAQPTFSYKQAEWQQKVDYQIDVTLDDANKMLNGHIKMTYTNNAPHAITEIYMHIWPNAYKNNQTAFAQQKNEDSDGKFLFADKNQKGYMDSLNFTIDGKKVDAEIFNKWEDVLWIRLNAPLESEASMVIETPFRVKIPGSFSRLGHADGAYQITQWYPKPAVYDINGWNPMPYLDQGEFYSEFGTFDVKITVPENFVVAATGELQEDSEKEFIRNRINEPVDPTKTPPTSKKLKTISYFQNNIHDFAWFASKTFNIERGKVTLESGKVVETFVYASEKKINHCRYINDALLYYSKNVGEYPYKFCTVVEGSLKAGGGMEYPMITVCDYLNEEVIVHEVGHNWFYGILGNNERTYPWMDESVNTFFEGETIDQQKESTGLPNEKIISLVSNDGIMEAMARHAQKRGSDQAPGEPSELLTGINYGIMVYGKGAYLFKHLKGYLGDDMFYDCFKEYFDDWKFRHPLPDDMQAVFESVSGKKLSWFFRDLMFSTGKIDYALSDVKINGKQVSLTLLNKGDISAPIPVDFIQGDQVVKTQWIEGFKDSKTLSLEQFADFDRIQIDARALTTEVGYRNNNYFKDRTLKYADPLKLTLITGTELSTKKRLSLLPAYGFNVYNKSMLGLGLHNVGFPGAKTEFLILPLYSTATQDLNGYAQISRFKPFYKNNLQLVEYGINSARFAFNHCELFSYNKIQPFIKARYSPARYRGSRTSNLMLRYVFLAFNPQFDLQAAKEKNPGRSFIYEKPQQFVRMEYQYARKTAIRPEKYNLAATLGMYEIVPGKKENFISMQGNAQKMINYQKEKKGLTLYAFGGAFLKEASNSSGLFNFAAGSSAKRYDYLFDQSMMDRSAGSGLFENQILHTESRQKFIGNVGSANRFMFALNAVTTLPGKLPLKIYADAVSFNDIDKIGYLNNNGDFVTANFLWQAGVSLIVIPEIFEIHVPLAQSEVVTRIQDLNNLGDFHKRISFVLNLNKLDPRVLLPGLKLF